MLDLPNHPASYQVDSTPAEHLTSVTGQHLSVDTTISSVQKGRETRSVLRPVVPVMDIALPVRSPASIPTTNKTASPSPSPHSEVQPAVTRPVASSRVLRVETSSALPGSNGTVRREKSLSKAGRDSKQATRTVLSGQNSVVPSTSKQAQKSPDHMVEVAASSVNDRLKAKGGETIQEPVISEPEGDLFAQFES
ncbi:hypothetical protein HYFRA_00011005 [Hymenoscyphus fraxineus]|uniref:Uncharacterized protein n=1 Tax=Hymenoscyphus fraxineus TaxID=746836 RepID=A0A9N9KXL7_9HELO|nr:hypothetical protein HYFRA_00011005 [Hymenoscyphus fraxineus]